MTREEFKQQVHSISDLIIDIADLNTPDDHHPRLSLTVSGVSDVSSVCIVYPDKSAKLHHISPNRWFDTTDPQEVIQELEAIKADLKKERKPHETDNKES